MAEAIQVNWQHANYNGQFHNRSFSFIKIKPHFTDCFSSRQGQSKVVSSYSRLLSSILNWALNTAVCSNMLSCVFPRSQSKWPPCYVRFPFSLLCSFKILRSTLSERGRAAVLFVGNLLTSNLLHIIRQKSLQLPSNNRYDQMCVLK